MTGSPRAIAATIANAGLKPTLFAAVVATSAWAVKLVPVVTKGLVRPVEVVVAPGEPEKLYVVEQAGLIKVFEKGKLAEKPFLDLRQRVRWGGEMGLLSLAFHPKYAANRRFFVNYTTQRKTLTTVVAQYKAGSSEEKEVLSFPQPYTNHNGGQLAFDKAGMFYVATGDGGSGGDPHGNGQRLDTWLGKILRVDVDAKSPYSIPPDNPYAKGGGKPEIFAYGMRNPWRMSFDEPTGLLFAADVGQSSWEEIDIIERGGNYGWNFREGAHCFEPTENCPTKNLIEPIHEYSQDVGYSITGGFVYRGKKIPALEGAYIYGDFGSGKIWALRFDAKLKKAVRNEMLLDTSHSISSFGREADGEILVVSHKGGVYRLVP